MEYPKLLTVKEAANVSRLRQERLYELIRVGVIPRGVVIRFGRQIRINGERWRDWMEAGGQAQPAGADRREAAAGIGGAHR